MKRQWVSIDENVLLVGQNHNSWCDDVAYHQMMHAAYRNDDCKMAREFTQKDICQTTVTYMAYAYLTYKMNRKSYLKR